MQVPTRIVLKGVPEPAKARERVQAAAATLERFHGRITACQVAVSNPDLRHVTGGLYNVHIVLRVPGHGDIVVSRRAADQREREHLDVALRKAFAQARRRVQDVAREMRGDVKLHDHPRAAGRVTKLFNRSGYGIIEDAEGREVYFHQNSVLNGGFRRLEVGAPVRFVESDGDKGPQASTVIPEPARRASRRNRSGSASVR